MRDLKGYWGNGSFFLKRNIRYKVHDRSRILFLEEIGLVMETSSSVRTIEVKNKYYLEVIYGLAVFRAISHKKLMDGDVIQQENFL